MIDGLTDKKNLIKMDEVNMCGISDIPQNLQIWSHTEIIGDDIIYLPHLGLFFFFFLVGYFVFMNIMEKIIIAKQSLQTV